MPWGREMNQKIFRGFSPSCFSAIPRCEDGKTKIHRKCLNKRKSNCVIKSKLLTDYNFHVTLGLELILYNSTE